MFASRAIASSILRRAAVSTIVARSYFIPLLGVSKSVHQPRISTNVIVRGFMATAFSAKDGYTSVYIGGLGSDMGDTDFMNLIEERNVEGVCEASITREKSGRSKGFGYVQFGSREDAEKAMINLKGVEYEGNPLKIDIEIEVGKSTKMERMNPATTPDAVRSSIFIGNLDFANTDHTIMDLCEDLLGPGIALRTRVAIDRETGRSKGFAHVDFASQEHANEAVARLTGADLLGRALRVDHAASKIESMNRNAAPALSPRKPATVARGTVTHSIFVGNLSWDVTPELLEDMVNDVLGPNLFTHVRLAIDKETGRQRGFGHIDFIDENTAIKAVRELDGLEVMGRQIRADHATKKQANFSRSNQNW